MLLRKIMRRVFFGNSNPVHIISRAVEGLRIFEKEEDCYRFIFQFYACNLGKRNRNVRGREAVKAGKHLLSGEKIPDRFIVKEHTPLVSLLDFSLVKNHFHFLLLENSEKSIPFFVRKLNDSFAKSFNLIYGRKGAVFGSRYEGVGVETEFQLQAVSRYVSIINPLDVFQSGWRKEGLRDWEAAFGFLKNYKFSSFPDKIGERKSAILAPLETQEKYNLAFNDSEKENYYKFVEEFLKESKELSPFFLE